MERLELEDKKILIESVTGGVNNIEFVSKKSSNNINIYKVSASDRNAARKRIQNRLRKEKIKFTEKKIISYSGEPITEFKRGQLCVRIMYKPLFGGMNETTLNSTITELVPCLMFHNNIKTNNILDLTNTYAMLTKSNQSKRYIGHIVQNQQVYQQTHRLILLFVTQTKVFWESV